MPTDPRFADWRTRIETELDAALPPADEAPARLHAAMRHACLGGGKRLRPLLVYAAAEAVGVDPARVDAAAVAVELVHAFSLVHDDLPAMDDDALRRGRPTVHVAFDEATAILAGDALQTLAFAHLAAADAPAALRVQWLAALAGASGSRGMCGGQALDMAATGQSLPLAGLEQLHGLKTGALIRAAVRMGALAGDPGEAVLARLDDYATALGLAFQIRDDLLDIEADSAQLGKTAGKDAAQAKATYPSLQGIDGARRHLDAVAAHALQALSGIAKGAGLLRRLIEFAVYRHH